MGKRAKEINLKWENVYGFAREMDTLLSISRNVVAGWLFISLLSFSITQFNDIHALCLASQ
jgi:hypothetical protein